MPRGLAAIPSAWCHRHHGGYLECLLTSRRWFSPSGVTVHVCWRDGWNLINSRKRTTSRGVSRSLPGRGLSSRPEAGHLRQCFRVSERAVRASPSQAGSAASSDPLAGIWRWRTKANFDAPNPGPPRQLRRDGGGNRGLWASTTSPLCSQIRKRLSGRRRRKPDPGQLHGLTRPAILARKWGWGASAWQCRMHVALRPDCQPHPAPGGATAGR